MEGEKSLRLLNLNKHRRTLKVSLSLANGFDTFGNGFSLVEHTSSVVTPPKSPVEGSPLSHNHLFMCNLQKTGVFAVFERADHFW